MLFEALTTRKTVTVGEKLIVPYKLSEVILLFSGVQCHTWKICHVMSTRPHHPDIFLSNQHLNLVHLEGWRNVYSHQIEILPG